MEQLSSLDQAYRSSGKLSPSGSPLTSHHLISFLNDILSRQRFISKVTQRLDEILTDYTSKVNKKRNSKKILKKSCELVCVHIRRGDHLVYKENLKHPVFIIVTDDPEWAHTQIHKSFKPYFTGEITPLLRSHDHHLSPGFYNQTQQDSAGLDMAVLSSCKHMVLSRGTFGLWGNILSGSSRVLPKHFIAEAVGKPLELRNQVPLLDLSHRWMDEETRAALREDCPSCLQRMPRNVTN